VDEADDLLERDWTGLCYTAALSWVREADDPDWMVVHGTVLSAKAGKRIEHAWCERGGFVADLDLPVGLRVVERDLYYQALEPEVRKVYGAGEAILMALKTGHDGPWDGSQEQKK
jgi:hypothetical protein